MGRVKQWALPNTSTDADPEDVLICVCRGSYTFMCKDLLISFPFRVGIRLLFQKATIFNNIVVLAKR